MEHQVALCSVAGIWVVVCMRDQLATDPVTGNPIQAVLCHSELHSSFKFDRPPSQWLSSLNWLGLCGNEGMKGYEIHLQNIFWNLMLEAQ